MDIQTPNKECPYCYQLGPKVCETREQAKKCGEFKEYFETRTR